MSGSSNPDYSLGLSQNSQEANMQTDPSQSSNDIQMKPCQPPEDKLKFWNEKWQGLKFQCCQLISSGDSADVENAQEASTSGNQKTLKIIPVTIDELNDHGWKLVCEASDNKNQTQVDIDVNNDEDSKSGNQKTPKLILSVFGWNSEDFVFQHKPLPVAILLRELVDMMINTESLAVLHGTERSNFFSMLGDALKERHEADMDCGACIVAVKDRGNPRTKNDNPENEWIRKYVICKDIADIHKGANQSQNEEVLECTVVINGDVEQVTKVLEHSVEKKRPVILIQGLITAMDHTVSLIQKEKESRYFESEEKERSCSSNENSEQLSESTDGDSSIVEALKKISSQDLDLLHVYDLNSYQKSIGETILNAIFKQYTTEAQGSQGKTRGRKEKSGKDRRKKMMLEMCVECGEFKVASDHRLLHEELAKEALLKAFLFGREDFIVHFFKHVPYGPHGHKEITDNILESCGKEGSKNIKNNGVWRIKVSSGFICEIPLHPGTTGISMDGENLTMRNIFIWAVLHEKFKLAKWMLDYVQYPIAAALFARGVLSEKVKIDGHRWNEYQDSKFMVEFKAFGELIKIKVDKYYKTSPSNTFYLLGRSLRAWGNLSLMQWALKTKDKFFFTLKPCKIVREEVWKSGAKALYCLANQGQRKETKSQGQRFKDCILSPKRWLPTISAPRSLYTFDFLLHLLYLILAIHRSSQGQFSLPDNPELTIYAVFMFPIFLYQEFEQLSEKFHARFKYAKLYMKSSSKICLREKCLFQILFKSFEDYITDTYNIIDSSSVGCFILVYWFPSYYKKDDNDDLWNRILWNVHIGLWTLRMLKFLSTCERFGMMTLMIFKMMKILFEFLLVLAIFFISYTLANGNILRRTWTYNLEFLKKPYWSMFGEFFLEEVQVEPSSGSEPKYRNSSEGVDYVPAWTFYSVSALQALFVFVVNIVLFNLLIARFSSAVKRVEDEADNEWCYFQVVIAKDYTRSKFFFYLPLDPYVIRNDNPAATEKKP